MFDREDLQLVFQVGEYNDGIAGSSTWATGDWNCDGEFDREDLVWENPKSVGRHERLGEWFVAWAEDDGKPTVQWTNSVRVLIAEGSDQRRPSRNRGPTFREGSNPTESQFAIVNQDAEISDGSHPPNREPERRKWS